MERAQREADGPRRRIIEAARIKATVRTEAPPSLNPLTPVVSAAQAAAAGAARRNEPAQRLERTEQAPALATLPAAMAPVPMPAEPVAAVQTVSRVDLSPAPASLIALPASIGTLQPPRLLSKVDPELPSRLQRRGVRRPTVLVEMTISVDGTVRDVRLRDTADDDVDVSVREAVRQWRYEPQPAARPHTVQLVFDAG